MLEDVSTQMFTGGDACYKILRTYTILNWCRQAGGRDTVITRTENGHGKALNDVTVSSADLGDFYKISYTQILKVHLDQNPTVTIKDVDTCIYGVDFDALPYGEEDQTPGDAPYECDEPKTWTPLLVSRLFKF